MGCDCSSDFEYVEPITIEEISKFEEVSLAVIREANYNALVGEFRLGCVKSKLGYFHCSMFSSEGSLFVHLPILKADIVLLLRNNVQSQNLVKTISMTVWFRNGQASEFQTAQLDLEVGKPGKGVGLAAPTNSKREDEAILRCLRKCAIVAGIPCTWQCVDITQCLICLGAGAVTCIATCLIAE